MIYKIRAIRYTGRIDVIWFTLHQIKNPFRRSCSRRSFQILREKKKAVYLFIQLFKLSIKIPFSWFLKMSQKHYKISRHIPYIVFLYISAQEETWNTPAPDFLQTPSNVTYHTGELAVLRCTVFNLGTKTVCTLDIDGLVWNSCNLKPILKTLV